MIVLKLNNKQFKFFSNVDISLMLDSIASTYSFTGFFDITNEETKELFKPLTYYPAEVWYIDDDKGINDRLITGVNINHQLNIQRKNTLTTVTGYSKTGVLEDVNVPIDKYPLQFDGMGLDQITKQLCDIYGLQLEIFDNAIIDAKKAFEQATIKESESIKSFLSKLARTRNITIAHDNFGRLLLYKVLNSVPPKIRIKEDDMQVLSIGVRSSGQACHSSITTITQASTADQNEGVSTVKSPFMDSSINRPKVVSMGNGTNNETKESATALMCAEAKNFPLVIELEGWTFNNKIVRAGFYIEVEAPSIFIETTKLILQTVQFKSDPKAGKTMTLTAVLPCVYTGVLPSKNIFT